MVGRPFRAPQFHVDSDAAQRRQQRLVHQDEIDAQTVVAAEGTLPVIPPAERFFRLFEMPEGIDEPERRDALQGCCRSP